MCACKTGTVNARSPSKGIDTQAGIVGRTYTAIPVADPLSLTEGIALEGIGFFRYIVAATDIAQTHNFVFICK